MIVHTLPDQTIPVLPRLESALLASVPGVIHGFTRRAPGLGLADGNASYSGERDRADAWEMRRLWCAAYDLDPETIVTCGQIHGADVLTVRAADAGTGARPDGRLIGRGDSLITNEPGVLLWSLHADCTPILFVDPGDATRGPAVGVAHAGWRGTVAGVVETTTREMQRQFGSRPARMLAFIGPAIGGCCYEVGPEVIAAWRERAGALADAAIVPRGNGVALDLALANQLLLQRAGFAPDQIEQSGICTRCQADEWFSHRAQGAATGRFAAFITLAATRER